MASLPSDRPDFNPNLTQRVGSRLVASLTVALVVRPDEVRNHDVYSALPPAGVTDWEDFATLTSEDIDDLAAPKPGGLQPIQKIMKGRLKALHAFYHKECRRLGKVFEPASIGQAECDDFRRSGEFNPRKELVQWNQPIISKELSDWRRSVKPNRSDCPVLIEAAKYYAWKRDMRIAAESQNMQDTLERLRVFQLSEMKALEAQKNWLFKDRHPHG